MEINLTTKILPFQTFLLIGKIKNQEIIEGLKKQIKEDIKISSLNHKTNVTGKISELHSLVHNEIFHNFLKIIKKEIHIIYQDNFIVKDAWGTLSKKGEEVLLHHHNAIRGFCGILYLTENGPGTKFPQYDLLVQEEIGKYVLFHPLLLHEVSKLEMDIERMTVAFNMVECKEWNDYSKEKIIK